MIKQTLKSLSLLIVYAAISAQAASPALSPLEQARKLSAAGKYVRSQKIYEKILSTHKSDPETLENIRKEYEAVNMKILFSTLKTPDSARYTVVPGDNLNKIAKKYKTTVELIKKSNGLQSDVIRPDMKLKVETGNFAIRVDKSSNILELLLKGKPLKHYRVATGLNNSTPTGEFHIINKLVNPTWYHAGVVAPPDSKENIIGTRWLGFDHPGYGIHGTTMPDTIGQQLSAGCVRMLNSDVEELYDIIPVGTTVTVID